jgi:hypothetical protein
MTPTTLVIIASAALAISWLVFVTILVNRIMAEYRERRRQGREVDPADRDFVRLCYVTLMLALWLGGW